MPEEIKYIIESLLFVSEEPLTIDKIKKVLETFDTKEIRQALADLNEEYEARKGGFMLHEVAGGYQIRTRSEYSDWIKRLVQPNPQRLSKPALETLAIIAYKQPLIRSDIEFIRGVDCGGVLRMLLEKKLIRVLGKKDIPGRPLIYATTKQFLELFGLKDLNDLPSPKEIQELGNFSSLEESPVEEDEQEIEVNSALVEDGENTDADSAEDNMMPVVENAAETEEAPEVRGVAEDDTLSITETANEPDQSESLDQTHQPDIFSEKEPSDVSAESDQLSTPDETDQSEADDDEPKETGPSF